MIFRVVSTEIVGFFYAGIGGTRLSDRALDTTPTASQKHAALFDSKWVMVAALACSTPTGRLALQNALSKRLILAHVT
jgi:hypothetical protein